jgi:hypothetical protein
VPRPVSAPRTAKAFDAVIAEAELDGRELAMWLGAVAALASLAVHAAGENLDLAEIHLTELLAEQDRLDRRNRQ